ncbi:hypothetical protein [Candidatus Enterovibrio escicola]|uniref:Uncharacterized protein n=1 Tax=Candidatus Enterovibrio escicola TaxID=1927127 RepID=A0A2A5T0J9_9GAMM|nr:hypothetical protein [Candidatus Enterovibrio escacola]PCS21683.1 hypothetical protein BTN49_2695 [Candidatus Enterovibrio escacola]
MILAEGSFFSSNQDWKWFQYLSLSQLRLLWQKHLLKLMEIEFLARQYVIITLWANDTEDFYAHLGKGRKNKVPRIKATKG